MNAWQRHCVSQEGIRAAFWAHGSRRLADDFSADLGAKHPMVRDYLRQSRKDERIATACADRLISAGEVTP
jgi:hypothetical protein